MVPSEKARKAGEEIAASSFPHVAEKLNAAIAQFVGWPYETASAALIDADGNKTATFSSVILAGDRSARTADEPIPADSAGAVIDVNEALDLERLRAAYRRIVGAKSLKKTLAPNVTAPCTNVTMGVIYGHAATVSLEALAEELQRLNASTPSQHWPDSIAVSNVGTIQYAVQLPGEELFRRLSAACSRCADELYAAFLCGHDAAPYRRIHIQWDPGHPHRPSCDLFARWEVGGLVKDRGGNAEDGYHRVRLSV